MKTKVTKTTTTPAATELCDEQLVNEAAKVIRDLLVKTTRDEALARYDVGQKVNEVRTRAPNEKYGEGLVQALAAAVGLTTAAALYDYGKVAKTWRRGVLQEYSRQGVSFSHFVELAHPKHAANREALLKRAAEENLSVRDLAAVRKKARVDILARLEAEGPSNEIRAAIEKTLTALRDDAKTLGERIAQLERGLHRCIAPCVPDESGSDLGKAAE